MTQVIRMSLKDWAQHMTSLGATRFQKALETGALGAAMRSIPEMQERTLKAPAASANGTEGAFDTGRYRAAWRAERLVGIGARIFNLMNYAGVIEGGRRRGAPVGADGIRNLELWARRKLSLPDKEARRAAFAIAKTIKERGLKARKVMTGEGVIEKLQMFFRDEVARALQAEYRRKP